VTLQEARQLYDHLASQWTPFDGRGEGLTLWHYRGGPWELADELMFEEQITEQ
jgi:hypothetical protein